MKEQYREVRMEDNINTDNVFYDCICDSPKGETEKAYKVWNGKSFSYLAKSQMQDVNIVDDIMYFKAPAWFLKIHPWIQKVEL